MRELRYVERMAGGSPSEPIVETGGVDITPEASASRSSSSTSRRPGAKTRIDIALDAHLGEVFLTRRRKESKPAAE